MSQCSLGKAESETARNRLTQRLLAPLHSGITSAAEVLRHAVAGMLDDVRFERVLSVIVSDRNGCLAYIQRLACRETLTPDERSNEQVERSSEQESEQVEQVLLAGEQANEQVDQVNEQVLLAGEQVRVPHEMGDFGAYACVCAIIFVVGADLVGRLYFFHLLQDTRRAEMLWLAFTADQ